MKAHKLDFVTREKCDCANAAKLDSAAREKRDCANAAKLLMPMTFAARR